MAGAATGVVPCGVSRYRRAHQHEHALVDFAHEDMDMAIRYGRGAWPGLRTDKLTLTDDFFPVCSPALLRGPMPLWTPADLARRTLV